MNPVMLDFPTEFESDRLLIRAPRFGDGAEVNAAVRESIDELRPWMPWAQELPTPEQTEENIRRAVAKFTAREDLRLNAYEKSTGAFVIGTGLHRPNWDVPALEIGYWVRTPYAGRGYVTEAVIAITRFAFQAIGVKRLEIRCDTRNTRSVRVAERAGFTREATLHHDARDPQGNLRDTHIYACFPAAK